jgi:tRNA (guanosine-2'-O-)-methyltransferase
MDNNLLIDYLSQFISERRLNLINQVLNNRTRYVTVVLEDIFQPQNASAVLRTCECLGIQDIYVIENAHQYYYSRGVAMGAGKWTDIIKFSKKENNTLKAVQALKENNYRIIATVPGENCISLSDLDLSKGKTAFVFGSELNGISQQMRESADELLTIPMYGFTESYNLSVSAAIILYQVIYQLKNSEIVWQLTDSEKNTLKIEWLKTSVKRSDLLIKNFINSQ